jgi:hypothetical protein
MSYALDPKLAAARGDEYRLAPEGRETSLAEHVLTSLRCLAANVIELGFDPSRIALMGAAIVVEAVLRLAQQFWRATRASRPQSKF